MTPAHLILISVDTLRSDQLGCYGNELGLTPNIDRLAAESEVFASAYAAAPFTLPSVASLMTGRYPREIGMTSNTTRLSGTIPTLASRLRHRGWKTGAVVSNFVLRPDSGLDSGFDEFDARFPQVEVGRKAPERVAPSTTEAALEMLDKLTAQPTQPIFLWVHFQDPHGPYTPPDAWANHHLEEERSRPDGRKRLRVRFDWSGIAGIPSYQYLPPHREVAHYRAAYDGEIGFMDEQVGHLLATLRARGILSRAVVVFVADHGESLGEDDYWFAHGEYLNEASLRVPLLMRMPGRPPRMRTDVASLVDVLPTIGAIFDLDLEGQRGGRNLLADGAERSAGTAFFATSKAASTTARIGLVRGPYKFIRTMARNAVEERLFHLPDERTDLSAKLGDISRTMRAELDAMYVAQGSGLQPTPSELSPEEREALRALGYVDR
jgi:arylsulfatase A-like enzyme